MAPRIAAPRPAGDRSRCPRPGPSARDPNPANYHPNVYAADVAGLLDRLAIPRAIFLGTSMGGIITMALAAIRPKLLAAAILNDFGPEIAPEGVARILSYAGKGATIEVGAMPPTISAAPMAPALPAFTDGDWDRLAQAHFREGAGWAGTRLRSGHFRRARAGPAG